QGEGGRRGALADPCGDSYDRREAASVRRRADGERTRTHRMVARAARARELPALRGAVRATWRARASEDRVARRTAPATRARTAHARRSRRRSTPQCRDAARRRRHDAHLLTARPREARKAVTNNYSELRLHVARRVKRYSQYRLR